MGQAKKTEADNAKTINTIEKTISFNFSMFQKMSMKQPCHRSMERYLPKFWEIPPIDYHQEIPQIVTGVLATVLQQFTLSVRVKKEGQHSKLTLVVIYFHVCLIQVRKSAA